jgi:hypothetical protein
MIFFFAYHAVYITDMFVVRCIGLSRDDSSLKVLCLIRVSRTFVCVVQTRSLHRRWCRTIMQGHKEAEETNLVKNECRFFER